MTYLEILGSEAKKAEAAIRGIPQNTKNRALAAIADGLIENAELIIEDNKKDLEKATANHMSEAMRDRLSLDIKRIKDMAEGVR